MVSMSPDPVPRPHGHKSRDILKMTSPLKQSNRATRYDDTGSPVVITSFKLDILREEISLWEVVFNVSAAAGEAVSPPLDSVRCHMYRSLAAGLGL